MTRLASAVLAFVVTAFAAGGCTLPVLHPLTPAQSRAQVLDAGRELQAMLHLPDARALYRPSACTASGNAPFRGRLSITFALAPTAAIASAELDDAVRRLRAAGWRADRGEAAKDGVLVWFSNPYSLRPRRVMTLLGQCRDVTTTKWTLGAGEPVSLD